MGNAESFSRRGFIGMAGAVAAGGLLTSTLAGCTPTPQHAKATWTPPASPMRFPKGYVWGAATSAYQIEGAWNEDGRGPSIWDTFCHERGDAIADHSSGDVAADHYHRWRTDLDLLASLGVGGYRFSMAWPRIQPTGSGASNQKGLDFYKGLIDGLLERGIRPAITLYHWDLPQPLQDAGGWPIRDTANRFADYVDIVFGAFSDVDADWFTLNEPKTQAYNGYWYGTDAPGLMEPDKAAATVHHQLLAHGLTVQAFHSHGVKGRIGPVLNLTPVKPTDAAAKEQAKNVDAVQNRLFLDPILKGSYPTDAIGTANGQLPADPGGFAALIHDGDLKTISSPIGVLGVNYYGVAGVDLNGQMVQIHPTSTANWEQIWAPGLYELLTRIKQDYKKTPIVITENGMPDDVLQHGVDDPKRIDYLRSHFQQAARAIQAGVPLEGHYVWALIDNFEWSQGYTQRWGLAQVDYLTQKRTPKKSFGWYRSVIKANAVAPK
ncbi:GH1 family beta-glucosidase [Humibacter sp.]|uniref:GH1 family beta-glucosidase n=1 Tax=Humibacter sp. TaxID=1940291 RepID=UPI002CA307FC|nr:GH1 family beta-glucosidase [Humibacter sp.]HVX09055.1 GH1 family beta-glucosidase [Humibacter sp.]